MLKMLLIHEVLAWHMTIFTNVSAQARKQVIVWAARKNPYEQEKDTEGEFPYPTHLI